MKEQEEILNGQVGNTLTDKTSELIEREKVPDTPFEIITVEGKSFVTLGKYRITGNEETKPELINKIYNLDYEFLINVMFAVNDMTRKMGDNILINQNVTE